jgi:hypothetical protein
VKRVEEDRWSEVRRSRSGSDEVRCGGRLGVGLCWVAVAVASEVVGGLHTVKS